MAVVPVLAVPKSVALDVVESTVRKQISCTTSMRIANESSNTIYFKVKSNRVGRYIVTPPVGVIAPNTTVSINISLDTVDVKSLVARFAQGLHIAVDKFLVLECRESDEMRGKVLDERTLNNFWIHGPANLASQLVKVDMTFSGAIPVEEKLLVSQNERLDRCIDAVRESAMDTLALNLKGTPRNVDTNLEVFAELGNDKLESITSEMKQLEDTYHELLQYAITLTGERDMLERSVHSTMESMAALQSEENTEKEKEDEEEPAEKSGDILTSEEVFQTSSRKKAQDDNSLDNETGFSFAQVLVVMGACFFIGRLFPLSLQEMEDEDMF